MKVVYTESPGKEKGVCYRRPAPFFGVINAATEVEVEGDHPNIVEAYERAGVEVNKPEDSESDRREFLVAEIERLTEKRPAANAKTETLEKQYAELTKDQE
ncbi:hypothetical protein [Vreelandella venusta]|uniref:hypothetical protein n=1 Tax=Vreelandella venusta TaxID=44935 RepID=UPI003F66D5DF